MGRLTDQIREYISSPQVDGNEHYGKWGALRKDQRLLIADLCEYCDLQEKYADTFFKEIQSLKQQLAEKDKEIKYYHQVMIEQKEKIDHLYEVIKKSSKAIRHQVCEEIRDLAGNYFELPICENCGESLFASSDVILTGSDLTEILDQIEQGE